MYSHCGEYGRTILCLVVSVCVSACLCVCLYGVSVIVCYLRTPAGAVPARSAGDVPEREVYLWVVWDGPVPSAELIPFTKILSINCSCTNLCHRTLKIDSIQPQIRSFKRCSAAFPYVSSCETIHVHPPHPTPPPHPPPSVSLSLYLSIYLSLSLSCRTYICFSPRRYQ